MEILSVFEAIDIKLTKLNKFRYANEHDIIQLLEKNENVMIAYPYKMISTITFYTCNYKSIEN